MPYTASGADRGPEQKKRCGILMGPPQGTRSTPSFAGDARAERQLRAAGGGTGGTRRWLDSADIPHETRSRHVSLTASNTPRPTLFNPSIREETEEYQDADALEPLSSSCHRETQDLSYKMLRMLHFLAVHFAQHPADPPS
ncbi:hypothetical protein HYALB_00004227 [Hymenoscyphus albidus]|uniref:Uncharacterized protein n=1 Tax=Hymenoscyphus albidus TaxID=595503 RepID=A0A9N9M015_9HELO|nr:hypothetical protein HYALB_00004227 [Hymenoscyphus albidus]